MVSEKDWDFYEIHEIGKFGRTISQKRIRVRKIKEVVTQDWFFN